MFTGLPESKPRMRTGEFQYGTVNPTLAKSGSVADAFRGGDGKLYLGYMQDADTICAKQWIGSTWVDHSSITTAQLMVTDFSGSFDLAVDDSKII
jgi:hypothetical protein